MTQDKKVDAPAAASPVTPAAPAAPATPAAPAALKPAGAATSPDVHFLLGRRQVAADYLAQLLQDMTPLEREYRQQIAEIDAQLAELGYSGGGTL